MADAAERRAPGELDAAGWLTEAERREVEETLELVVDSVRQGHISSRFGDWLIRRLAEEKAAARVERLATLKASKEREPHQP